MLLLATLMKKWNNKWKISQSFILTTKKYHMNILLLMLMDKIPELDYNFNMEHMLNLMSQSALLATSFRS